MGEGGLKKNWGRVWDFFMMDDGFFSLIWGFFLLHEGFGRVDFGFYLIIREKESEAQELIIREGGRAFFEII